MISKMSLLCSIIAVGTISTTWGLIMGPTRQLKAMRATNQRAHHRRAHLFPIVQTMMKDDENASLRLRIAAFDYDVLFRCTQSDLFKDFFVCLFNA